MPEICPYCHAPSTPFGFAGGWLEYECGFREDVGAMKQLHTRPAECYRREGAALQAEVARLAAIVGKLPVYVDTGEPIVRGAVVWLNGGPLPARRIVHAVLNTSVLLAGCGLLSFHQHHLYSTREAAACKCKALGED